MKIISHRDIKKPQWKRPPTAVYVDDSRKSKGRIAIYLKLAILFLLSPWKNCCLSSSEKLTMMSGISEILKSRDRISLYGVTFRIPGIAACGFLCMSLPTGVHFREILPYFNPPEYFGIYFRYRCLKFEQSHSAAILAYQFAWPPAKYLRICARRRLGIVQL